MFIYRCVAPLFGCRPLEENQFICAEELNDIHVIPQKSGCQKERVMRWHVIDLPCSIQVKVSRRKSGTSFAVAQPQPRLLRQRLNTTTLYATPCYSTKSENPSRSLHKLKLQIPTTTTRNPTITDIGQYGPLPSNNFVEI